MAQLLQLDEITMLSIRDKPQEEEKNYSEMLLSKNIRSKYFARCFRDAIKQISNHVNNDLFTVSAAEDIEAGLIALLDDYTIKFLNDAVNQYRESREPKISVEELSAEQAIQELNKYYETHDDLSIFYPAYNCRSPNLI